MKPQTVLVVIDGSAAAAEALVEASRRYPGERLHVVHLVDVTLLERAAVATGLDGTTMREKSYNRADVQLEETLARLRSEGFHADGAVHEGKPERVLAEAATACGAHTVVLGLPRDEAYERLPWALALATGLPVLLVATP